MVSNIFKLTRATEFAFATELNFLKARNASMIMIALLGVCPHLLDLKKKNNVQFLRSEGTISSQAGLRADGAGESALPAEESPWRLRALSREREL